LSAVKERILGAVTVMREEDAIKVWEIIKARFAFDEDMPTDEEMKIMQAYKNGDEEYQPCITHEDLRK
jgi:hypothetical protein